jgi:hypothetical protein
MLEHPGIARLVDGGVTAQGLPYFAMELVEGEPIDAYCDGQRLTVEQPLFALPLVTAGEWRLALGDARGADSLARMARSSAALDSLCRTGSGLVGRAELLLARALSARNETPAALEAARRASVALSHGYGSASRWPHDASALLDSLSRRSR